MHDWRVTPDRASPKKGFEFEEALLWLWLEQRPERPGVKLRGQARCPPPSSAALLPLQRQLSLRLFVLFFASGLTRGITMSWTTPWFRDDEKRPPRISDLLGSPRSAPSQAIPAAHGHDVPGHHPAQGYSTWTGQAC